MPPSLPPPVPSVPPRRSAPGPSSPRTSMRLRVARVVVFVLALMPLARAIGHVAGGLEVNPVEFVLHSTGTWALSFLLITLTVTPLRRLTGWNVLVRFRRMLGLYAFFYACLHLLTYAGLDQGFDVHRIAHDVVKRPFITVGFAAFVLLVPLAITSTQGWVRRLKRHWTVLHRLIYPIALLGVLHYWWLVKRDHTAPLLFGAVLLVLLAMRPVLRWRARTKPVA